MNESTYQYTATYSAEDNSLRIYGPRMSDDVYSKALALNFKYGKYQELYVCKKWTPNAEDFCMSLAGEITPEKTTIIERAEMKVDRLDKLSSKRTEEANIFFNASQKLSQRFHAGQPILRGHHSEKSALRDRKKLDNLMRNSVDANNSSMYWNRKAEAVERHANYKSNPRVRKNRITGLMKDLRDKQNDINHANYCLKLWENVSTLKGDNYIKRVKLLSNGRIDGGATYPHFSGDSLHHQLINNYITNNEAIKISIRFFTNQINNKNTHRWISHILNRLSFERGELGEIPKFEGDLTPVILQKFARDFGVRKPKATKTDLGFILKSTVDFPSYLADSDVIECSNDDWVNLIHLLGYEIPLKKPRKKPVKKTVPLVNPTVEEANRLQDLWYKQLSERRKLYIKNTISVEQINQKSYSELCSGSYASHTTIEIDDYGRRLRFDKNAGDAVNRIRVNKNTGALYSPPAIVVLSDKPKKPFNIKWDCSNG